MDEPERRTLPNGLRTIKVHMPYLHSAVLAVYIRIGPRFETPEDNGLSHFVEHMLFKGTSNHPNGLDISEAADEMGAELNGATVPEYSEIILSAHRRHLEKGAGLLAEMITQPLFTPEQVERERSVILEEIGQYRNDAGANINIDELSYNLMWPGQSFSFGCLGPEANVARFDAGRLRAHYERYYVPGNIVVCLGGNFEQDRADAMLEEMFGSLAGEVTIDEPPIQHDQHAPRALFQRSTSQLAYVRLCHKACSYNDPDLLPVLVISDLLGGGISSRLFSELREERGLVYDVNAQPALFSDVGSVDVLTSTTASRLAETIGATMAVIRKLIDDGVSQQELAKMKDRVACHMELMSDSPLDVVDWFGAREMLSHPEQLETPADVVRKLADVTPDDVNGVMRKIFVPERRALAVVGPIGWLTRRRVRRLLEN